MISFLKKLLNFYYLLFFCFVLTEKGYCFNISDNFYGKFDTSLRHTMSFTGGYKNGVKFKTSIGLDLGFNLYYKISNRFNAFIGVESTGKYDFFESEKNNYQNYSVKKTIIEYLILNLKSGLNIEIAKNYNIQLYGLIGSTYNILTYDKNYYDKLLYYMNKDNGKGDGFFGFNVGCGVDLLIKNLFFIGFEYRKAQTKYKYLEEKDLKFKKNEIFLKIGFLFG